MKRPPNRILLPLALGVAALAGLTGIPAVVWGGLWILASVWVIVAVLRRLALAPR